MASFKLKLLEKFPNFDVSISYYKDLSIYFFDKVNLELQELARFLIKFITERNFFFII